MWTKLMLGSMLDSESLTQQAVRRQLAAMPNKFYWIRLIHSVERKPAPAKRLWTAEELVRDRVVRSLRADNRLGFNVYLWPYAERRKTLSRFIERLGNQCLPACGDGQSRGWLRPNRSRGSSGPPPACICCGIAGRVCRKPTRQARWRGPALGWVHGLERKALPRSILLCRFPALVPSD